MHNLTVRPRRLLSPPAQSEQLDPEAHTNEGKFSFSLVYQILVQIKSGVLCNIFYFSNWEKK